MDLAHIHLLLNHFPIIGTIIALGLFIASFIGKNEDLKRSSLIIFAAIAFISLPVFFSGVGAKRAIEGDPGISAALIDRHEGAAMLAIFFVLITGALALVELYRSSRISAEKGLVVEYTGDPDFLTSDGWSHGKSGQHGWRHSSPGDLGC